MSAAEREAAKAEGGKANTCVITRDCEIVVYYRSIVSSSKSFRNKHCKLLNNYVLIYGVMYTVWFYILFTYLFAILTCPLPFTSAGIHTHRKRDVIRKRRRKISYDLFCLLSSD